MPKPVHWNGPVHLRTPFTFTPDRTNVLSGETCDDNVANSVDHEVTFFMGMEPTRKSARLAEEQKKEADPESEAGIITSTRRYKIC